MYELKRLQPKFEILIPTCMYHMRNINLVPDTGNRYLKAEGTSLNGEEVQTVCGVDDNEHNARISIKCKSISQTISNKCALDLDLLGTKIQHLIKSEAEAVVKRQEKILQQLNELREQLVKMRANLNLKETEETTEKPRSRKGVEISENGGLQEEPLHDIVINCHPNFIPYSLLALKNVWKDLFNIAMKTFTHSSLPQTNPAVLEFEQKLNQIPNDSTKPTIKVTLIWKNCEHTEMITSRSMYVPIYGEVNIIRYLGRIGPSSYRYETSSLCNEIDSVLDICYQLLRCNSVESRRRMLQLLNDRLQNQKYFGGNDMSMADIGVCSSLKRIPNCREKELTPTLREWHKRAQLITMI